MFRRHSCRLKKRTGLVKAPLQQLTADPEIVSHRIEIDGVLSGEVEGQRPRHEHGASEPGSLVLDRRGQVSATAEAGEWSGYMLQDGVRQLVRDRVVSTSDRRVSR